MEIIISTTDPNTAPLGCQNQKHAKEYWKSVDATEKRMLNSRNSMAVGERKLRMHSEKSYLRQDNAA